jgi:hypothetical protein
VPVTAEQRSWIERFTLLGAGEGCLSSKPRLYSSSQTSQETALAKRTVRIKKKSAASRSSSRRSSSETWQLQTAKARFREWFRRTLAEGGQTITRQDKEAVVMLTAEESCSGLRRPTKACLI